MSLEFLDPFAPEFLQEDRHGRLAAAIAERVVVDDLTFPFRIEKILPALRLLACLHDRGVDEKAVVDGENRGLPGVGARGELGLEARGAGDRAERLELVVRDLQVQREKTDAVLAAVTNELKKVPAEVSRLDALARDLKDKQLEIDKGEQKNIDKIGTMYDAMSPEAAAPSFQKMVDEGKVDFAAKILNQMKERNASRILEALEPSVALMILERMRNIRPAAKTP